MPTGSPTLFDLSPHLVKIFQRWQHRRASSPLAWGDDSEVTERDLHRSILEWGYFLEQPVELRTHQTQRLHQNILSALNDLIDFGEHVRPEKLENPTDRLLKSVEPFLYKLLALIEPEQYQKLLPRKPKPGLANAIEALIKTKRLKSICLTLKPQVFESIEGWKTRSSIDNAIRDVMGARNPAAHGAPSLVTEPPPEELNKDNFHQHPKLWQSIVALMLHSIHLNRDDIIRARLRHHGIELDEEAFHDDLYGQLIDRRFLITGIIGRGGMGMVYRGFQISTRKTVAIKKPLFTDEKSLARWHREHKQLTKLKHPNIVQVIDSVGKFERPSTNPASSSYLIMEYVDGLDLRDLIDAGNFSPQLALAILEQLASALDELHKNDLVHRDIKPENIRVSIKNQNIHVTLLDLGIVLALNKNETRLTQPEQPIGTHVYMSPEQRHQRKNIGPASDCYSIGVIFYEMLTGTTAHFERNFERAGLNRRRWPGLNDFLDNLVRESPQTRIQNGYSLSKHIKRLRHSIGLESSDLFSAIKKNDDLIHILKSAEHLRDRNQANNPNEASKRPESPKPVLESRPDSSAPDAITPAPIHETPAPELTGGAPTTAQEPTTDNVEKIKTPQRHARTVAAHAPHLVEFSARQTPGSPPIDNDTPAPIKEPKKPADQTKPKPAPKRSEPRLFELKPPQNADQLTLSINQLCAQIYTLSQYVDERLSDDLAPHQSSQSVSINHRLMTAIRSLIASNLDISTFSRQTPNEQTFFEYQHTGRPLLITPLKYAGELLGELDRLILSQQRTLRREERARSAEKTQLNIELKSLARAHRKNTRTRLINLFNLRAERLRSPQKTPTKATFDKLPGERTRLLALLTHRHLTMRRRALLSEKQPLAARQDDLNKLSKEIVGLGHKITELSAAIP